jgi:hypothetical protein
MALLCDVRQVVAEAAQQPTLALVAQVVKAYPCMLHCWKASASCAAGCFKQLHAWPPTFLLAVEVDNGGQVMAVLALVSAGAHLQGGDH